MSQVISQQQPLELWQVGLAVLISLAAFGIQAWQTFRIRDLCRWWQPFTFWFVPGYFDFRFPARKNGLHRLHSVRPFRK